MTDGELDLSAAPLSYPGPMIDRSVVLDVEAGVAEPLTARPPDDLHDLHDLLGRRTPVMAVGSNASAGVMLWKLRRDGVGGRLPLLRATVRDLRVSASAHVGRPGFVPAAPAHAAGAVSEVVIGWLDREQLDCVDRTEPNYRRVTLDAADYPVECEFSLAVAGFEVYESNWGVLAEAGAPLRLPTQSELAEWLGGQGLPPWNACDPAEAVARLAGSIDLRDRAREAFRSAGLAVSSGLRVARA